MEIVSTYLVPTDVNVFQVIQETEWRRVVVRQRSNYSAPIPPPGQAQGQLKNVCDKKGQGSAK